MAKAASLVLATVNAPYGANLSAHQLAALIANPKSASDFNAPVFSFFSEVTPALQLQFVEEMGVDAGKVGAVASQFSHLSGYALPLAT
jgi:hypothetical protein